LGGVGAEGVLEDEEDFDQCLCHRSISVSASVLTNSQEREIRNIVHIINSFCDKLVSTCPTFVLVKKINFCLFTKCIC